MSRDVGEIVRAGYDARVSLHRCALTNYPRICLMSSVNFLIIRALWT